MNAYFIAFPWQRRQSLFLTHLSPSSGAELLLLADESVPDPVTGELQIIHKFPSRIFECFLLGKHSHMALNGLTLTQYLQYEHESS